MPVIYHKTALAHTEIASSQRILNFRQRQVLILVDGKRTSSELCKAFAQLDVDVMLQFLLQQGYIAIAAEANAPSPAVPVGIVSVITGHTSTETIIRLENHSAERSMASEHQLSEEILRPIQMLLLEAINQHLGLMGKPLKQKIMLVDSEKTLLVVLSQWHMAMRDSKSGRDVAEPLMQEIQTLLTHRSVR